MCLPANHRLLLRTACVLQQQYARRRQSTLQPVIPQDRISQVIQQAHRLELATHQNLTITAQHGRGELRDGLRWLIHDLTQCQESLRRAEKIPAVPPLRLLYDELASLTDEFEEVQIELRDRRITVYTLPIVLDDMDLGSFEIRLNLREIGERAAYEVIAVDPQSSGSGHSHPRPRARVQLDLSGIVPDVRLVNGLRELLSTTVTLDLFKPFQRERIRLDAVRLVGEGQKQRDACQLIEELPTQPALQNALALQTEMDRRGLSSPYILLTEPPSDYKKLRRHQAAHFQFEPLAGYVPPELT